MRHVCLGHINQAWAKSDQLFWVGQPRAPLLCKDHACMHAERDDVG
jgi:hypothetical protein